MKNVLYYFYLPEYALFKIANRSPGISMGCNGGTFAPPVLPMGTLPANDFTPQRITG